MRTRTLAYQESVIRGGGDRGARRTSGIDGIRSEDEWRGRSGIESAPGLNRPRPDFSLLRRHRAVWLEACVDVAELIDVEQELLS